MKAKKRFTIALCIAALAAMAVLLPACAPQGTPDPDQPSAWAQDAARLTGEFLGPKAGAAEREAVTAQVASDLALLEHTAFRHWVKLGAIEDGAITYHLRFDEADVTDHLQVEQMDNGDIAILITEEDREDRWVYQENGQVFCHGMRMKNVSYAPAGKESSPAPSSAVPLSHFNQAPESIADLFTADQQSRYALVDSAYVSEVPLPGQIRDLTLASVWNTLVSSVSTERSSLSSQVPATVWAATGRAAGNAMGQVGGAVLSGTGSSSALSYRLHKFADSQTSGDHTKYVYVVDVYGKTGFYGDHFVWGIGEEETAP